MIDARGQTYPARIVGTDAGADIAVLRLEGAAGLTAAGIAPGDVLTAAAGHLVSSPDALTAIVNGCRPGTVVRITWIALVRLAAAPAA